MLTYFPEVVYSFPGKVYFCTDNPCQGGISMDVVYVAPSGLDAAELFYVAYIRAL